jgi:hypothetical protein
VLDWLAPFGRFSAQFDKRPSLDLLRPTRGRGKTDPMNTYSSSAAEKELPIIKIQEQEGGPKAHRLKRNYEVQLSVKVESNSFTWFVVE